MVEVTRLAVTVDLTGLLVDLLVVDHVQGPIDMLVVTLGVVVVVVVVVGGPDVPMVVVRVIEPSLVVVMVVVKAVEELGTL